MKTINDSVRRRILAAAAKFDGVNGCWEWAGSRNVRSGYGQLSAQIDGRCVLFTAHRAIFEALHGPQSLHVLHRCDNPPCFNPAHLFTGTPRDNMVDMWRKGRQQDYSLQPKGDDHPGRRNPERLPRGEQNNKAKLTADAVRAIRASADSHAALGRRYGVTDVAIAAVRAKKTWKHV
jgi:hypothetical protein